MGPRRRIRAPRASLAWFLAGFIALQLGLAVAIEFWLPVLRDPLYVAKAERLRHRLEDAPARPRAVVMVGSSRTVYGLQGTVLEDRLSRVLGKPVVAFNLGMFSAGPVKELLVVRRLLAAHVRPDLLLIEVLPPYLAGQEGAPAEVAQLVPDQLWLKELAVLGHLGLPVGYFRQGWYSAWPLPWFAHRFEILSCVAPSWVPLPNRQDWGFGTDRCGWAPALPGTLTAAGRRQAEELARREYAPYLAGFRLGGPSAMALHDLLELCRAEKIPAALVLMPEGTAFRAGYPPAAWVQIDTFLSQLRREFHVPLINAREWLPDEDFCDSHHLLAQGAEVFSRRLGGEVLRLLPDSALSQIPGKRVQEVRTR